MKADVIKALLLVSASFQNFKLPEGGADVWVQLLEDIPAQALQRAVASLCASSEYPPTIAAIRKEALAYSPEAFPPLPGEAWREVINEIGRVGWCGSPSFTDPMIARAVQCVSNWQDLCTSDMSDMPAHRARFLEAYEALRERDAGERLLPETIRREIGGSGVKGILE